MVKVLSLRFQQCFGPISMLLVEGSSETELFRLWFNQVFRTTKVQKYITYEGHLFFENFQNEIEISKIPKKISKKFFFWNNSFSICCYKLCLLRREYLSSAVNRLTNSPTILDITQRDFFNLNCLHRDQ